MSNASIIPNQKRISAAEAGRQFGYTNDYVTRLAREKKVNATRVGKQWYVDAASLESFVTKSELVKKEYADRLRAERKKERVQLAQGAGGARVAVVPLRGSRAGALAKAGMVVCVGVMAGGLIFVGGLRATEGTLQQAGVLGAIKAFALRLYGFGEAPVALVSAPLASGVRESDVQQKVSNVGTVAMRGGGAGGDALVVVPPSDTRSSVAIANSFADEVRVVRDADGKSGVITPIFKSGSSTQYRYLMVPMGSVQEGSP